MTTSRFRWTLLLVAGGLILSVLGLYQPTGAAPQVGQPPFANPVDQQNEMIRELKEIKALLQEQNALLRGGAAKTGTDDRKR